MTCLCCGKEIRGESENGWHKACIRRFFGSARLPELELTEERLRQLAIESVNKGLTVAGVQKKLSLHLTPGHTPRLTLVGYPSGYILKPQTDHYRCLPEAEFLVMKMAERVGLSTVPCALLHVDGRYAYITARIDRILSAEGAGEPVMFAMEDFCQLDHRLTQDKYRGSYERCAKIIDRYSVRTGLDLSELFLRLVFSYLIGNSDMHLKNFSLIETSPASGKYVLSAAYDMLPVNLVLPEDTEAFALPMNGKKRNLRRNDFLSYAESCGMDRKTAGRLIDKMLSHLPVLEEMCRESLLPEPMRQDMLHLLESRAQRLRSGSSG